jgi:hypothetical protein
MARKRPPMYLAAVVPPEEEPMKRVQHTLTSAELLHLKASPVQLLPSPGPGKRYTIFALFCSYHHVTTPYTQNGNIAITSPSNLPQQINIILDGLINTATHRVRDFGPTGIPSITTTVEDAPLQLSVDGPNELLDGDGTLLLILYYTIESST